MTTNILDTIDLRVLGELLQQARKKCNMTQADAAKISEIIKHWSEVEKPDSSILSNVLNTIRIKGRFIPPKNDPLRNWWTNAS